MINVSYYPCSCNVTLCDCKTMIVLRNGEPVIFEIATPQRERFPKKVRPWVDMKQPPRRAGAHR